MRSLLLALLLLAPAASGQVLPLYEVGLDGPGPANFSDESSVGVSLEEVLTYSRAEHAMRGAVDSLGARGFVSSESFDEGGPAAAGVRLTSHVEDVVFTNEADPDDDTPIEVALRLDLRGHFDFSGVGDPALAGARASAILRYRLGSFVTHDAGRVTVRADSTEGDTLQGVFAGLAEPMTIDGTFTTPFHEVTPGIPLVVGFELILSATAGGSGGAGGDNLALADFDPGVGFATGGPVFELPPGYTASSPLGGVVGNFFVPEPQGAGGHAAMLAALSALALRRQARRR